MKAGAKVEAVLDTAPFSAKLNLLRGLALQPGVILRGMRYAAELVARGVPVLLWRRTRSRRRRRARHGHRLAGARR